MKKIIKEKFIDFIEDIYYPEYIRAFSVMTNFILRILFLPFFLIYKIIQYNDRKYP